MHQCADDSQKDRHWCTSRTRDADCALLLFWLPPLPVEQLYNFLSDYLHTTALANSE